MRKFIVILCLFVAACARPPAQIWKELPDSEVLLEKFHTTTGQVTSIDAAATVTLDADGKFFSSQQFLLLKTPDLLRTDVLSSFGQLILQLASNGEELAVYSNTTSPGRFYYGQATAENLFRFTRIPLAASDIVRLLIYDPPLIDYRQRKVLVSGEDLVLQLSRPGRKQELVFDAKLRLVGCRYFSAGEPFLEVLYQHFEKQPFFPRTIRIELAEKKTEVAIKFSEILLNSDIPMARFMLKKPDNAELEALP